MPYRTAPADMPVPIKTPEPLSDKEIIRRAYELNRPKAQEKKREREKKERESLSKEAKIAYKKVVRYCLKEAKKGHNKAKVYLRGSFGLKLAGSDGAVVSEVIKMLQEEGFTASSTLDPDGWVATVSWD